MIKRKLAEVENEVKRRDKEIKSPENKINTFLKIEDAKQFEHEDDSVKKPFDEDHAKCELNGSEPIWNDSLNPKSRPQQQENLVSLNVPEVTIHRAGDYHQQPYKCKLCGERTRTVKDVKQHIVNLHGQIYPQLQKYLDVP